MTHVYAFFSIIGAGKADGSTPSNRFAVGNFSKSTPGVSPGDAPSASEAAKVNTTDVSPEKFICDQQVHSPKDGFLLTLACKQNGTPTFALEGSIFVAGAALQWLKDQLDLFVNSSDTQDLAMSVESSEGVVFIPTFSGLGTPHWNPNVRAAILGLTRGTSKAHIIRGALESVAFQANDLIVGLDRCQGYSLKALQIDGGMANNSFFTYFLSSILQMPITVPQLSDITAYGAAKLCANHQSMKTDFNFKSPNTTVIEPEMSSEQRNEHLRAWEKAVQCVIDFAS